VITQTVELDQVNTAFTDLLAGKVPARQVFRF